MVATRMRDTAFKRVLKTMELGTELAGRALWLAHAPQRCAIPAVFLSGGIGVTPVRSIVLQATHDKLPHKIVLFDSNRRPEDSAFLEELTEAQRGTRIYPRRHDDGDGEIEPSLERGDGFRHQGHAREIGQRSRPPTSNIGPADHGGRDAQDPR